MSAWPNSWTPRPSADGTETAAYALQEGLRAGMAQAGLAPGALEFFAFRPIEGFLGLAGLLLDLARLGELGLPFAIVPVGLVIAFALVLVGHLRHSEVAL